MYGNFWCHIFSDVISEGQFGLQGQLLTFSEKSKNHCKSDAVPLTKNYLIPKCDDLQYLKLLLHTFCCEMYRGWNKILILIVLSMYLAFLGSNPIREPICCWFSSRKFIGRGRHMYGSRMLPSWPLLTPATVLWCHHLLFENQTTNIWYPFSYCIDTSDISYA